MSSSRARFGREGEEPVFDLTAHLSRIVAAVARIRGAF